MVAALATVALSPLTALPAMAVAGTYVVTSTSDAGDTAARRACTNGTAGCTLRAALAEANAFAGPAVVHFGLTGTGPFTIAPATRLPGLTNPAGITIDGYSQPGSAPNTLPKGSNADIEVQVRGAGAAAFHGFVVTTPNNVVRGLAVYNFRVAFQLLGTSGTTINDTSGNRLVGNFICTDAAGVFGAGAVNGGAAGVLVNGGANHNVIGTRAPADRNVISGCAHRGVTISYAGTSSNTVTGNIVGLNPAGTAALPNRAHGLDANYGAQNNRFEANVVSGNLGSGIEISHGKSNRGNEAIGNFVGTDVTGTSAPDYAANVTYGIRLEGDYPCDNPTTPPCPPNAGYSEIADNVIVNSSSGGLLIDKGQQHNWLHDNLIGVLPSGEAAGNLAFGVRLEYGSVNNLIGPDNEIAFNAQGIQMQATGSQPPNGKISPVSGNTVTRNRIHDNRSTDGTERLGLDLSPYNTPNVGGVGDASVQGGIQAPTITRATGSAVQGTACGGCTVEVYLSDTQTVTGPVLATYGEGETYLATATAAADGSFTANLATRPLDAGQVVTATATRLVASHANDPWFTPSSHTHSNTSEFSRNVVVQTAVQPGAPTITTLTTPSVAPTTTLTVGWTPPSDVGGSPLTGYRVTVTPAVGPPISRNASDVTSLTVSDLAEGTTYRVTVAARNASGLGAESSAAQVTTRWVTQLVITSPVEATTVSGGETLTVTGLLTTSAGQGVAGKVLRLYSVGADRTTRQVPGTVTTDAQGVFAKSFVPDRTARYYATFGTDAGYVGSRSAAMPAPPAFVTLAP